MVDFDEWRAAFVGVDLEEGDLLFPFDNIDMARTVDGVFSVLDQSALDVASAH
jgi:hypothetical protein